MEACLQFRRVNHDWHGRECGGRHGAGVVAKSLHPDPEAAGRDRQTDTETQKEAERQSTSLGLAWAFEAHHW